jgi:CcmD family protein
MGFGLVWLLLALYLFWLGHRQTVLQRRLAELQARGGFPEE